jgi:hypothetical protein
MHVEIKRLDVASVVKISFVIYTVVGIMVGIVYVLVALVFGSLMNLGGVPEGSGLLRLAATGFGVLLIPLFALFYGCIGAVGGAVLALVYNAIAKTLGGVRITLTGEGSVGEVGGSESSDVRL